MSSLMNSPLPTRIAITGAAGFLGRSMTAVLGKHFPLRLMDIQPVPGEWESRVGDVAKLEDAMALCEGCSHLVIGHMAPNRPEIYATPTIPFDVNVKGTANLFHAASEHGIKRVVLISSGASVQKHWEEKAFMSGDLSYAPKSMYALTKALQEVIARSYHDAKGMEVAVLRPAYICDEDSLSDKYGTQRPTVNWQFIDPRDIAEAARLALTVPQLGYEIFYTLGHPDAEEHADVRHLRDFLGWKPQHTFEKYPRDGTIPGT
jgi:nucleoside-diphosphate-sugar epimerase